jgi:hypothetical protein
VNVGVGVWVTVIVGVRVGVDEGCEVIVEVEDGTTGDVGEAAVQAVKKRIKTVNQEKLWRSII